MHRRWVAGAWIAVLAAVVLSISACRAHHVEITIRNQTGSALQLLEVDYPSASFGSDTLAAGATFRYRIQVEGNGPITVSYTGLGGKQVKNQGPDLGNMQQGRVDVVLLANGKADFHAQVSGAQPLPSKWH